jgi:hypothetical protein
LIWVRTFFATAREARSSPWMLLTARFLAASHAAITPGVAAKVIVPPAPDQDIVAGKPDQEIVVPGADQDSLGPPLHRSRRRRRR